MLQKVKTKNAPRCCLVVRMLQLKWQREICSEYFTQNGHRAFSRKQTDSSVGSGTGHAEASEHRLGQSRSSSVLCAATDQVAANLEQNKAGHPRGEGEKSGTSGQTLLKQHTSKQFESNFSLVWTGRPSFFSLVLWG